MARYYSLQYRTSLEVSRQTAFGFFEVPVMITVSMLPSAFRGKETSKMVSSMFALESEMLYNFQAKFFKHNWHSYFRVIRMKFFQCGRYKTANKI